MNTTKKTRIENMLSTYQELTDWADKEVIPKLYKSGVICVYMLPKTTLFCPIKSLLLVKTITHEVNKSYHFSFF